MRSSPMKAPLPGQARSSKVISSLPADARLLAIAGDRLRELGPKGVTVVGVAAAAGITHAAVYRYFPSRAALIDAIAARWLKGLEATLAAIADAPDPADDKLERLIQALARAQRDLLSENRHLFEVYCTATETSQAVIRKHRARRRQLIERVLDEGIATAKFDPRDRDRALALIADSIYRFVEPLAVRLDADMPQDISDARLAAMIRVVVRALSNGTV